MEDGWGWCSTGRGFVRFWRVRMERRTGSRRESQGSRGRWEGEERGGFGGGIVRSGRWIDCEERMSR